VNAVTPVRREAKIPVRYIQQPLKEKAAQSTGRHRVINPLSGRVPKTHIPPLQIQAAAVIQAHRNPIAVLPLAPVAVRQDHPVGEADTVAEAAVAEAAAEAVAHAVQVVAVALVAEGKNP
jgi:hypothetical protein